MSTDQSRFEAGMTHILSVSREEMKRRLAEDKTKKQQLKRTKELAKGQTKGSGKNLNRP